MARSGLILPSPGTQRRQPPRQPSRRSAPTGKINLGLDPGGPPAKHRRPRHSDTLARPEPLIPKRWLIAVILLSLLLHVLMVLAFVLVGRHTPKWPDETKPDQPPEVSLVLAAPPPSPPPRRPDFIPTNPDASAPHQPSPFISDNDAALKSQNRVSRAPEAALPDVTGAKNHSFDLHTKPPSPLSKAQQATPPTPQKEQPRPQNQKPVAKPNDLTRPAPPEPSTVHPSDQPEKTPGDAPTPPKPSDQMVDPNGLPVLPPIAAPTLAPQTPETTPVVPQVQRKSSPQSVPSFAVYQSDIQGSAGQPGDNSPAAMATDLGRYKAKVYRAVGARWYQKVNNQIGVLGVGTVHITYTIYSDGRLEIRADPDAGNPSLMILHSISLNSMTEAAPFDPFSDKLKREVGDSYTDDFSFSIYGN